MNPGPVEEAGKAVGAGIDALKSTPVILAVLVFNLALMAMIAFSTHENGNRWERMLQLVVEHCRPAPTTSGSGFKLQSEHSVPFTFPESGTPPVKQDDKDVPFTFPDRTSPTVK